MNENNQENQPSTSPGQVMDVKVTPVPVEPPEDVSTSPFIPTVEAAGDPVGTESDVTANEMPNKAGVPVADQYEPTDNFSPPAAPSGHKASGPLFAIIAAVLVAVGLAAVTVYAYINSTEKDKKGIDNSQQESTKTPAVTSQDVDNASNDVDDALNSTEDTDFPDSELTDQSLGL